MSFFHVEVDATGHGYVSVAGYTAAGLASVPPAPVPEPGSGVLWLAGAVTLGAVSVRRRPRR
ncbi:PEP-CTERM sorting domain-containing protein [Roseateles cellulosilyticus]|uniref:PEP-CTERM sorting domain-containing protein n=1 Tax=Pelomonas cellulosilytica TaxID=2906762 RepID=A0ABS8XLW9_9BURK|nr:PEP-CTERM sorting domain-containing protein [Pelomonas sp. P8]MCE4553779.1 PEP-CTERM sorting domain-containing protein [Pelomonas sp. P8]